MSSYRRTILPTYSVPPVTSDLLNVAGLRDNPNLFRQEQYSVLAAALIVHFNWFALIVFHGVLVPNTLSRGIGVVLAMAVAALAFIPGDTLNGGGRQVTLQIAETEAEPRTVIRYIITPQPIQPGAAIQ